MKNKGERRTKVKKVEMSVVKLLLKWRDEMNAALEGTGFSCTLRPRKSSEPCVFCRNYKKCHHYEWERDYIYKQEEAKQNSKIRGKRQGKIQRKNGDFDIEDIDSTTSAYPCYPFDFCCPDRDTCHEGEDCPWHEPN